MNKKFRLTKKERKLDPCVESGKDYIAFDRYEAYAGTDIPLRSSPGMKRILSPKDIWEDFDSEKSDIRILTKSIWGPQSTYVIEIEPSHTVTVLTFCEQRETRRGVLYICPEGTLFQRDAVQKLIEEGFLVCVADVCGVFPDTATSLPVFSDDDDEPRKTKAYLYTKVYRRVIAFLKKEFSLSEVACLGVGDGVEYAMRLGGIDDNVCGVGCLCAGGYPELSGQDVETDFDREIDEKTQKRIAALSGVSYLRYRKPPVFVGIGTNGTKSDVGRMRALSALVGKDRFRLCLANGFVDNVDGKVFASFLLWLRLLFLQSAMPTLPEVSFDVKKDGIVYATVRCDGTSSIKSVDLYYSTDEGNHSVRSWAKITCETIDVDQYIGMVPVYREDEKIFFYADVTYENGTYLSGLPEKTDLAGERVACSVKEPSFVFSFGKEDDRFNECNADAPVLLKNGIEHYTVSSGSEGIVCYRGSMIIFLGNVTESVKENKILQIDNFSEEKEYFLTVSVLDKNMCKYTARVYNRTNVTFETAQLTCSDFKDEKYRPLKNWKDVRALLIESKDVVIGKLLFV